MRKTRFWFRTNPAERALAIRLERLNRKLRTGLEIDTKAIDEAENLLRISEIHAHVRRAALKRVIPLLGVAVLLGACWLLQPLDSVYVGGSVRTTSVRLVNPRPAALSFGVPIHSFAASGTKGVRGAVSGSSRSVSAAALTNGSLTLQQISVPTQGATVEFQISPSGQPVLRIQAHTKGGFVEVSRRGPSRVVLGGDTARVNMESDRPLRIDYGTAPLVMRFQPIDPGLELLNGFIVDSISFDEVRRPSSGELNDVLLASSIVKGRLDFPAFPNGAVDLRPRQLLSISPEAIAVHRIRLDSQVIVLEFDARARKLALGADGQSRNLIPTRLEWLAGNRPLNLARAAVVSTMLLLLGVAGWWVKH